MFRVTDSALNIKYTPARALGTEAISRIRSASLHHVQLLSTATETCCATRNEFERAFEQTRRKYGFFVTGYVVMPEHVHLLMSEPERRVLSTAIQSLKQSVSRTLSLPTAEPFWQERYYDFNVHSEQKRIEKLRYMHRNPVERGLVEKPEDWAWSSFRHYATGVEGVVEIESEWTARRREGLGVHPQIRVKTKTSTTPP